MTIALSDTDCEGEINSPGSFTPLFGCQGCIQSIRVKFQREEVPDIGGSKTTLEEELKCDILVLRRLVYRRV